jgi:hypothetical protein
VCVEGGCDLWGFEVGMGLGEGGEEGREWLLCIANRNYSMTAS